MTGCESDAMSWEDVLRGLVVAGGCVVIALLAFLVLALIVRWVAKQTTMTDRPSVTVAEFDGEEWIHASIAGPTMPSYDDLTRLHRAVFGDGYAYQVFAPASDHVNIHEHAVHLWGRADGARVTPDFGRLGSI